MAKPISGEAYLVVGAFMTGFSVYVNTKRPFGVFIFVGAMLIVIGLIKKLGQKKKVDVEGERRARIYPAQNRENKSLHAQHVQHAQDAVSRTGYHAKTQHPQPNHKQRFCTNCGSRLRPDDRFCAHCGRKAG